MNSSFYISIITILNQGDDMKQSYQNQVIDEEINKNREIES